MPVAGDPKGGPLSSRPSIINHDHKMNVFGRGTSGGQVRDWPEKAGDWHAMADPRANRRVISHWAEPFRKLMVSILRIEGTDNA